MHVALFKEVTQKIDLMNVIRLIFLAISLYYMPEGMPKHETTQWCKFVAKKNLREPVLLFWGKK